MHKTKIDWCDYTWNPVWGCRNSCPYCYARRVAKRFGLQVAGRDDFAPTWIEKNFQKPMPKKPSRIFVNSMSDIAYWKQEWAARVMERIRAYPEHLFLFLTKDPSRVGQPGLPNVMVGQSVWNADSFLSAAHWIAERYITFLSVEPILGDIDIGKLEDLGALRWIIVGAETGNRRERVVPELAWLQEIYRFCRRYQIPLFFKSSLRHLWPADAEFPQEYPEPE